jgi:hypothetical protein
MRLLVSQPKPLTADVLRPKLFAAVAQAAAGDDKDLIQLCTEYEDVIFYRGFLWAEIPASILANPHLLRWYDEGLTAIAAFGAQALGKPELEQLAFSYSAFITT